MKTNKQSYNKSFLSINQQIKLLKSRGMQFDNQKEAKHYLSNISYYRLSGYWLIFQQNQNSHKFKINTKFDDVLNIYIFDRELRLLVLDAIETIEVSIRSKMAYYLSKKFGAFALLKPEIFYSPIKYAKTLTKLKSEIDRNDKELFLKHFKDKYIEELPPIWTCIEVMTMGQISYWYSNIKDRTHRQNVAKYYNLDEKILCSFLHHLTIVRNTAAHHSRLWNKKFTVDFILPKIPISLHSEFNQNTKKNLYNTLVMCEYLMKKINKDSQWKKRLDDLITKHNIDKTKMGY